MKICKILSQKQKPIRKDEYIVITKYFGDYSFVDGKFETITYVTFTSI